jgi:hypothetical protein
MARPTGDLFPGGLAPAPRPTNPAPRRRAATPAPATAPAPLERPHSPTGPATPPFVSQLGRWSDLNAEYAAGFHLAGRLYGRSGLGYEPTPQEITEITERIDALVRAARAAFGYPR